jgi:hypothetical protein
MSVTEEKYPLGFKATKQQKDELQKWAMWILRFKLSELI